MTFKLSARNQRDYSPVSWTEYFDEAHDISINHQQADDIVSQIEDSFRVYLKNFQEPYAPNREPGQRLDYEKLELSSAELENYSKTPTLVALHGGGYSGLTWAQFAKHIEQHCQCRVLAIDLRGHGDTKTSNDDHMDIDTLVSDVIAVTHAAHQICGFPETPKIVLIGHSMGGAIAVKCATKCTESLPSLAGFVIIDVVEGTAKDALPLMMSVIKTRPTKFPSLSNAIEWSVRSGMAKNSDAARVSMPGNLVNISDGRLSIHDVTIDDDDDGDDSHKTKACMLQKIKRHKFSISLDQLIGPGPPAALLPRLPLPSRVAALKGNSSIAMLPPVPVPSSNESMINEEQDELVDDASGDNNNKSSSTSPEIGHQQQKRQQQEEGAKSPSAATTAQANTDNDGYKRPPEIDVSGYGWRTNLAKTQPYWNGWFDGLSAQLLSAPVQGKFLLLAGIDRLDKTLTIGHMQGKFMMKVLPKCGHAVHEDVPEQVALAIGDFLVRNKFTTAATTMSSSDDDINR